MPDKAAPSVVDPELAQKQDEELESMRAIVGEDWEDLPPSRGAWGRIEEGWWRMRIRGCEDRVGVTLKGRLTKVSWMQWSQPGRC